MTDAVLTDEGLLKDTARSGQIDYDQWPALIEPLLHRLNYIVQNNFPLPRHYSIRSPEVSMSSEPANPSSTQQNTTLVSQTTPSTPRTLPPVPPFPGSASSISQVPNSQPEPLQTTHSSEAEGIPPPELPVLLAQLLTSITTTLRTSFATKPPHTLQRLVELILHPTHHYRTLPSYLRALDRVVSVSSTADIFPLSEQPPVVNGVTNGESGGILWKNDTNGHDKARDNDLGSDESLGGALLTPIPWLRDVHPSEKGLQTSDIGGDADEDLLEPLTHSNPVAGSLVAEEEEPRKSPTDSSSSSSGGSTSAASSTPGPLSTSHQNNLVPERQDGAVTQGELIRMEQEAGVVPVTHSSQSTPSQAAGRHEPIPNSIALGVGIGLEDLEDEDEGQEGAPHARGPDVVGTVDMGRVDGRDVQVRIGSPPDDGLRERRSAVNVNDAQDVLEGSSSSSRPARPNTSITSDVAASSTSTSTPNATIANRGKKASSDEEEGYVHVSKDINSDEMQVDDEDNDGARPKTGSTEIPSDRDKKPDDEDIVLVDADGATEFEREKIDDRGGQVGNDAGDTTR